MKTSLTENFGCLGCEHAGIGSIGHFLLPDAFRSGGRGTPHWDRRRKKWKGLKRQSGILRNAETIILPKCLVLQFWIMLFQKSGTKRCELVKRDRDKVAFQKWKKNFSRPRAKRKDGSEI